MTAKTASRIIMRRSTVILLALAALPAVGAVGHAQIAVSANVGAVGKDGTRADTALIIDLNVVPPKVLGEVAAPAAVQGPPQSVAIAPDESIALVTGANKPDPKDPSKTVPNDTLTVIDLKAKPPVVLATLRTGMGATGVSINRAGTMALVANRSEGSVSVFTISGKTVTPAGKVAVCDATCEVSLPVFTPDGTRALLTRFGDSRISVLSIRGTKVEYTKYDIAAGLQPYSLEIAPRGDVALVANVGSGLSGGTDIVSVIDLTLDPPRVIDHTPVGPLPEGISLSPEGNYLSVTAMNHSQRPKDSPFFRDFGLLRIFRLSDKKLTPITEAKVGHSCQGSAWNKSSDTILVQCTGEQEILVFHFDGKTLTPSGSIKVNGRPSGIRTAARPPAR